MLSDNFVIYVVNFAVALIFMALILFQIGNRVSTSLPIIIIILIFYMAYFVRFNFIVENPSLVYFLVPVAARETFESAHILKMSYIYLCVSFISFCASVCFFRLISRRPKPKQMILENTVIPKKSTFLFMIALSTLCICIINIIFVSRGIGKMGEFAENPLPFKITGILIYLKSILLPFLLITFLYWAKLSKKDKLAGIGLMIIVISGIFDMFAFESRGIFLVQIVTLGIVWLLAEFKISMKLVMLATIMVAGYIFSVPIIISMRNNIPLDNISINQILDGINFIFFRITGLDQSMIIFNLGQPLSMEKLWDVYLSPRGVAGYYTTELLEYDDYIPQTFAPSFLGYLYLIGGLPAIMCGSMIVGFLVTFVWERLDSIYLRTAPVVKSYFIIQIGFSMTEGPSKTAFTSFIIVAIFALIIEFMFPTKARVKLTPSKNA
jgi:hypothetical protein